MLTTLLLGRACTRLPASLQSNVAHPVISDLPGLFLDRALPRDGRSELA